MKNPVGRLVFSYPENSGLLFGFEHLHVVTWSKKKLVGNYTALTFPGITSSFCGEVNLKRGSRK
jgi:hypothetical protein